MKHLLLVFSLAISSLSTVAQTNSIQLRNGSNSLILAAPSGGAGGNYVLLLPASNGTNGQVLSTNGSGTLSWTTITSGATSLDGLSDAKSGGSSFTGSLMLGQEPASLGVNALNNTAVGIGALNDLTTGDNNVAIGYNALGSGATSRKTLLLDTTLLRQVPMGMPDV
jgi:hypothetical protein